MDDDQALRHLIMDLLKAESRADDGLTQDTSLADGGLGLTSLELVRLLVTLEEHLGIELDDAAIMNASFNTIDDILTIVAESYAHSDRSSRAF